MEKVYIFKYDNFKRFVAAISFLFIVVLGFFFVLIQNWFAVIVGILMVFVGIFRIFDILFFDSLIIYENFLIKKWYIFGQKSINLKNLKATATKRVWSGSIFFSDKNKGYFSNLLMSFETFPIGNESFREIRNLLIEKKIIQGDEHEWNY